MTRIDKQTIVYTLAIIGSSTILIISIVLLILSFHSINVLNNWAMTTDRSTYRVGELVTIHSVADKKYALKATSSRTLVCGRSQYNLSNIEGKDSKTGRLDSFIEISIPTTAKDNVPKECKFVFDVTYGIYGFRSHGETNSFIVKEE